MDHVFKGIVSARTPFRETVSQEPCLQRNCFSKNFFQRNFFQRNSFSRNCFTKSRCQGTVPDNGSKQSIRCVGISTISLSIHIKKLFPRPVFCSLNIHSKTRLSFQDTIIIHSKTRLSFQDTIIIPRHDYHSKTRSLSIPRHDHHSKTRLSFQDTIIIPRHDHYPFQDTIIIPRNCFQGLFFIIQTAIPRNCFQDLFFHMSLIHISKPSISKTPIPKHPFDGSRGSVQPFRHSVTPSLRHCLHSNNPKIVSIPTNSILPNMVPSNNPVSNPSVSNPSKLAIHQKTNIPPFHYFRKGVEGPTLCQDNK